MARHALQIGARKGQETEREREGEKGSLNCEMNEATVYQQGTPVQRPVARFRDIKVDAPARCAHSARGEATAKKRYSRLRHASRSRRSKKILRGMIALLSLSLSAARSDCTFPVQPRRDAARGRLT